MSERSASPARRGRRPAAVKPPGRDSARSVRVEAAVAALTLALRFEYPADGVMRHFFRAHPRLGQSDRAFVAEAVFGVLRRRRILEHVAADSAPGPLVMAWVARYSGRSLRELAPLFTAEALERMAAYKTVRLDACPPAVLADLPDWVYARLARELPDDDVLALGRALQEPAPLDLRVNTLRADRAHVLAAFAASGITAAPTPYSPLGVRVAGRPALQRHPLFLEGAVEVQDEGSQLVGLLVSPRRRDLIVDFCAGAGGKTLLMGALMHSQGRIYAFDVSAARIAHMKPRLRRSGLTNVQPHRLANENDIKVKRLAGKIDRVLVDAPCTGFGTLRRNPDLKWRQTPAALAEMRERQAAILGSAARLVKRGGRLVYATCSLLREENEAVVDAFLELHPEFAAVDCAAVLSQHGIALDSGRDLRLWPHRHGTDGFFASILERMGGTAPLPG